MLLNELLFSVVLDVIDWRNYFSLFDWQGAEEAAAPDARRGAEGSAGEGAAGAAASARTQGYVHQGCGWGTELG